MSDIVERLRLGVNGNQKSFELRNEAANEIERLLAVVIRLQKEKRELKAELAALTRA